MIPGGTYTGVVDRFEDTLAVLQLEDGEDRYNLVVGEEELPENGRHQDAVLRLVLEDEKVVDATYDAEETDERLEEAQSRFDRLSSRPPTDEDE